MLFEFDLTPLDQITPWGSAEQPSLHWFGLSDGHYWMEPGDARLFQYSDEAQRLGAPRYCNYQVARMYEDVVDALPYILEPVPADLIPHLKGEGRWRTADCMAAWKELEPERDDKAYWATIEHATTWIGRRELSTAHLRPSVDLAMWSDEANVHIEWNNCDKLFKGVPAWSAGEGSYSMPRTEFADQVRTFHQRLMDEMAKRVRAVRDGALPNEIHIDISGLLREHDVRASLSSLNFSLPTQPTDWQAVRTALKVIYA